MGKDVRLYKDCMVELFVFKYHMSEFEARKLIKEYDFDRLLKSCNYIALHDDPESWVDAIYDWKYNDQELLEM